jgi:hypothetical protein
MSKVVSLADYRMKRKPELENFEYHAHILSLDKMELLEEMVRFQEERSKLGYLSVDMMIRGRILFKALEENAETEELRILTRSYRRHLDTELQLHMEKTK